MISVFFSHQPLRDKTAWHYEGYYEEKWMTHTLCGQDIPDTSSLILVSLGIEPFSLHLHTYTPSSLAVTRFTNNMLSSVEGQRHAVDVSESVHVPVLRRMVHWLTGRPFVSFMTSMDNWSGAISHLFLLTWKRMLTVLCSLAWTVLPETSGNSRDEPKQRMRSESGYCVHYMLKFGVGLSPREHT